MANILILKKDTIIHIVGVVRCPCDPFKTWLRPGMQRTSKSQGKGKHVNLFSTLKFT